MTTIVLQQTPVLDLIKLIGSRQLRVDVRVILVLLKKLFLLMLTPIANLMVSCWEFVTFTLDFLGGRQLLAIPLVMVMMLVVIVMVFG